MMLNRTAVSGRVASGTKAAAPAAAAPRASAKASLTSSAVPSKASGSAMSVPKRAQAVVTAAMGSTATGVSPSQEKTANPMNIVMVATEVAPWSKTGERGGGEGGMGEALAEQRPP